jgi:trk system potassium uptake protein TrkA
LQIISPVALGTHRLAELLCYSTLEPAASLGNGDIEIVTADAPALLAGRQVQELTAAGEVQVVALSRDGKTILPSANTRIESGDLLHIAVHRAGLDRLKAMLDGGR